MASKYDFSGTLALVTGGASGMGLAAAIALAEAGATVIVADINQEGAMKTVDRLKGKNHTAFKMDVSSEPAVEELSTFITSKYKRCPNVVIHAAGIVANGRRQSIFQVQTEEWNRVLDVNLKGTFLINKTFGGRMLEEKVEHGSIVNFSSVAGRHGVPTAAEYCAAKAGVNSLTESFGTELASAGIRVNAVAPFFIPTTGMIAAFPPEFVDKFVALNPSKRMGTVEEVVNACLFLASKDSSYINGQIIHITGAF